MLPEPDHTATRELPILNEKTAADTTDVMTGNDGPLGSIPMVKV
jgi:hypothetical protein